MQDLTSLRLQAYKDLTLRARGGIIIYLAVWLITSLWVGMHERSPLIFYTNTFLFTLVAGLRTLHYLRFKADPDFNPVARYRFLVGVILFSGLHWGLMSAWVIYGSPYETLFYPYMVLLAAFALGGTTILSISFFTSTIYPFLIYVPTVLVGKYYVDDVQNHILAVLAVFSAIYVIEAARVSRRDYWRATQSQREAEDRARELEKLTITDPLTGLYNRMFFTDRFAEEWSRCGRLKISLSLLMIDIDHFKSINDNFGHMAGDSCLKEVSAVLKHRVQRVTDTVVRFGGEEFVVMLPDTNEVIASVIAQSLLESIAAIKPTWGEGAEPISCSIGVASVVPDFQKTRETLLRAADDALYQAKSQGRNQYCAAKPGLE